MVERNSGQPDALNQPAETKDSQLVVETRRYADVIAPSPLEEAFDAELQRRFKTALLEPTIDHGQLTRVSYPVIFQDSLVAFQYTRYDLLKMSPGNIASLLLAVNPTIQKAAEGTFLRVKTKNGRVEFDDGADIDAAVDRNDRIIDLVKDRLIERDGTVDPKRAVSDPTYYSEGTPIVQWPENFEFVVFGKDNQFKQHVSPSQIERLGNFAGRWADFYGTFYVDARYQGVHTSPNRQREGLNVYMPANYRKLARAYDITFIGYTDEKMQRTSFDYGDIGYFGKNILAAEINIIDPKNEQPHESMKKLGGFISLLTS